MERQEIRDIYTAKGFKGKLLDDVVNQITSDPKIWLEIMMTEELGFAQKPPKPGINGLVMSAAFVCGALIPTMPYILSKSAIICIKEPCAAAMKTQIFSLPVIFFISLILSVIGLFMAGALKTKFTRKNILLSAIETLLIGAAAASGSYGIGVLLG